MCVCVWTSPALSSFLSRVISDDEREEDLSPKEHPEEREIGGGLTAYPCTVVQYSQALILLPLPCLTTSSFWKVGTYYLL